MSRTFRRDNGRPESLASIIGWVAQHQCQTRGCSQRALPRIHSESGRRRRCYGGVSEYNRLPFDANIRSFRPKLRRHLLRVQHGEIWPSWWCVCSLCALNWPRRNFTHHTFILSVDVWQWKTMLCGSVINTFWFWFWKYTKCTRK